ncbi:MAG TPA: four helix bundle protein [Candidatus Methylomirabilis sp.]|nr:four helix bundle protein [Candidatus Methylomirabilis sp.]
MPNQGQSPKGKKYDLAERTATFGEMMVDFVKSVQETVVTRSLLSQVMRSGTSIGANYMEADAAESKRDFEHKIRLCKKEAKETMHWLRMLAKAAPDKKDVCRRLWREAHELALIFSAIAKKKLE